MFREDGGRPNDARGFVHKSFIGRAVGGFAKRAFQATPVGQAVTFVQGLVKPPARATIPRSLTARPTIQGQQGKALGRALKFGDVDQTPMMTGRAVPAPRGFAPPETMCVPPAIRDRATGRCRTPAPGIRPAIERFLPGGRTGFLPEEERVRAPVGDAVMGRYGAALQPGVMMIERSVCLPGMQLGNDGLCYNKGAISNKERQWPRGRKPLLTGGDMRAIAIAARAGATLDRTTKRLRALGMMKKLPAPRKALPAHQHAKALPAVSI